MYSSYSAAALALRTAKPSYNSHSSYLPSHHCQRYDGESGQRELLPLNPHLSPRFPLDGFLLRHSTHLLLLSSRIRPPPPPHPPHCFRQRAAVRCCCSGECRSGRSCLENVYWRPEARGNRCCRQGTGSSDLGMVCRQLKARGCGCGSSGSGRLGLGTSYGHRDTRRLLGRAVRQEIWEYDGGEWRHRGCSMECHGDWEEEEEGDECGIAQREVPGRSLLRRRWKEEGGDRCRECRRRKGVEIDYCDGGEYNGHRRETRDLNGVHGRFLDSDRRRLEQRGYYDDEDDLHMRRRREMIGRERRDFELDDAFDMKRVGARRYSENDRKYDSRRERRDSECEDVFDAGRVRDGRYTEDGRRFDRRRERMDFKIDSDDDVTIEERHRRNNDERYVMRNPWRKKDSAEVVSLSESHRWHDNECDNDDQDIAGHRHYSGRFPRSPSALHKDDSQRASSSRNTVGTRLAREDSASRVHWHDNVDRRAAQTLQERDRHYSSLVSQSNDDFDCEDAQLVRVRDSRMGTQDVKVITEDDTRLISSSKNTSILKHGSNLDQQIAARKDESKKISQRIMETSEVRGYNTELDSATRSYNHEDRRNCIDNKSSSLQSSVKMTSDSRRQSNQHDEVDQSVVALTELRTNSEQLTDIKIDSGHNVSRASHSQRNYEEVNQMDLDDRSTSIENITHITRDKNRYVNQQVIHETDIDVQNVSHVDVSKIRASDILVSRTSQNQSETRSDVNSISNVSVIDRARGQQEQIHQNKIIISNSPTVRGSQSHLGTGLYGQVHLTSVIDSRKDMQEQVENTNARSNNAAMPSTSESHILTRADGQFQPSSSVNTVGSVEQQIDLTKIHDSDTVFVSNSYNRSDHEACRTKPVNPVDKARDSHDKNDQQIRGGSSTERSDQSRTKFSESFQDSRKRLTRVEETGRLMQHNMALNSQQAGTSRISDDKDTTSLEMESSEEASIFNADIKQQAIIHGGSETTAGQSMLGVSSARNSVKESLLESAARLEKSSTFHVGQFVGELQRGVSDADTTLTKKNEKSIMEGTTRSSSRSRMKGPSDEIWDVQSATSQETFQTADKEEDSSADGGTNSASQTPKSESVIAKRVHKSLWAYVADIVRLGWVQRGESHDPSNKSFNKSSSSNSKSTEGWLSSKGHDNDRIQKRNWGTKPKDHQLMKSQSGESESRLASALKDENLPTGTQGLQMSEAGHVPEVGSYKGDFVPRISKDAVQISGERVKAKQSEVVASPKGNIKGGLAVDSTSTSIDVTVGHSPEHEAATSSSITTKRSTEINVGKEILGGTSLTINAEEVGKNDDADNWRYGPSAAITPYHHPQTQAMVPHDNTSYAFLESAELPTGGFTRMEEKIVVQQAPEVIRTEGKDAELKRRKIQRNKQVLKETFDEWEEAYQHDAKQRKTDELFMREALLEAQRAADIWEVPVGAVLVHNGEIIARGCNLVEDLRDSTAHAEICCIREASNKLKTWRLAETTLYVTLEPCAMCAGAILQARVDTVVWGAPNKLLGADGSWVRLFPGDGQTSTLDPTNQNQTAGPVHPFHPKIIVRRGVLSAECSEIMQQFFQLRRKKKQRQESPPRARHSGHHHHPTKFFTKMHHMFGTIFCL